MHTLKAALSRRTAKQVLPLVARARRTRKLSDVYGAEYCVYAIMRMHAASINEEMAQKMHVHAWARAYTVKYASTTHKKYMRTFMHMRVHMDGYIHT